MNIIDYARVFGGRTFEEIPFGNADAAIFAALSYGSFEGIAPEYTEKDRAVAIKDLTDAQIEKIGTPKTFGQENAEILRVMRESVRFGDVTVQFFMKVSDEGYLEQFCAMTFHIPFTGYYVCYRGTDSTNAGWEENFSVMYRKASAAQLDSIEYLHIVLGLIDDDTIMIGGHSKGGNLSFYAMLYSDEELAEHISRSYSFDGSGFYDKDFTKRPGYEEKLKRMVQLVPRDSFVGEFYHTPNNHRVIEAEGKGVMQHHLFRWVVGDDGDFVTIAKRSFVTRMYHRTLKKWAEKSKDEDKQLFVSVLIKAFSGKDGKFEIYAEGSGVDIKRVKYELRNNRTKEERKRFNRIVLKLVGALIGSLFHYLGRAVSYPFRALFGKK